MINGTAVKILTIYGYPEELPEITEVTGYGYDEDDNYFEADAEVKASDRDGFDKMVTVSKDGRSVNYYISYFQEDDSAF